MNIIAAVNTDWGIGYKGKQTIIIPEDRRFFKKMTLGGTLIVGRKTFEDLPDSLPSRKIIVLTGDKNFKHSGVIAVHSIEEVRKAIECDNSEKVFVAGGASVYGQLIDYCKTAYITRIQAVTRSDAYLIRIDELKNWSLEHKGAVNDFGAIKYTFDTYRRNDIIGKG